MYSDFENFKGKYAHHQEH